MLDYSKVKRVYCNENLLLEVADELKLNVKLVREVVQANEKFIRQSIARENEFDSIILPYLGKLKTRDNSIKKVKGIK